MQLGDGTKLLLLLKDTYYNHGIRRGWYRLDHYIFKITYLPKIYCPRPKNLGFL